MREHGTSLHASRDVPATRTTGQARAPAAVAREARALVGDLFWRSPRRYWMDLIASAGVAYGSIGVYLLVPLASPAGVAALVVAAFALFRAGVFIHEIAHFPRRAMRGFVVGWNMLVGVPLCTPSHFYGNHRDHHNPGTYGTPRDGEYLPFARAPARRIALYFLQPFMLPLFAVVRFVLMAPLSALSPKLRRWVLRLATSYVTNPYYQRPDPPSELWGWELVAELASGLILSILLGAWIAGWLSGSIVLRIYVLAVLAIELNWIRNLAGHRFGSDGRPVSPDEQFSDSITVLGPPLLVELLFPVGLRYHALHHLLPGIPYHHLAEAHGRLLVGLSPEPRVLYISTFRRGVTSALAEVWRSARASGDRSIIGWWRARAALD
jgi:fatty acid desaturase